MKRLLSLMLVMVMLLSVGTEVFAASTGWKDITVKDRVRWENGSINLKELGINIDEIIGFDILRGNKRDKVYFSLEKDKVEFATELKLNTDYRLRVITENDKINVNFKTEDLPDIKETGDVIVVKVPAMPEKGFKWPYYLRIPSNDYKDEFGNAKSKRYLMVDTANSGSGRLDTTEFWVKEQLIDRGLISVHISEQLWAPMIMPVFPNTNTGYYDEKQLGKLDEIYNFVYENSYDRDVVMLKSLMKDEKIAEQLVKGYGKYNHKVEDFYDLGEQLNAMFDHAVEYLNKYGHNVETDKMFFCGFSASGAFGNRFSTLYPEKVKAVFAGAAEDDFMLPVSEYKGENLIYPIGTYDYKEITGKEFNLEKHNSVARLYHNGYKDTNDTVTSIDCFGEIERKIIEKLFSLDMRNRGNAMTKLYGESGAKGAFVIDMEAAHNTSREMNEYILEFFLANRDSDKPVYPDIKTNKLKATVFK